MNASTERLHAASGYLVVLFGIAGAAFERGSPPAGTPADQMLVFFSEYRNELLAQSLMFVLSAGVYLWFYGALRSALLRAEGGSGTVATIAFGAGLTSVAMQMLLQVFQVGVASAGGSELHQAVAAVFVSVLWAVSVIAYVPLAVMFAAVAIVSLRDGAFPAWIGWLSAGASAAHLVMTGGLVVGRGPLVPGGVLTYALYASVLVWLLAVTTVMVRSR
jgi:hypothetical protein